MSDRHNVYEGEPDARQSDDLNMKPTRFRPRYRQLSNDEVQLHDTLKSNFGVIEQLIETMPTTGERARYRALALTALEVACFWAIKQLTSGDDLPPPAQPEP